MIPYLSSNNRGYSDLFNFIIEPLKWIVNSIFGLIASWPGAWGWSIVLFTIIVRLLLWPLDIKQKIEMKKTTDLQPLLKEINEKHKNDPDKKNAKTAELYKTNKVNPIGGCLPLLIQMPILFALFAVLNQIAQQQTAEMIQKYIAHPELFANADIFKSVHWLWVNNVWQPDITVSLHNFLNSIFGGGKKQLVENVFLVPDNWKSIAALKNIDFAKVSVDIVQRFKGINNGLFILPILAGATQFFQMKFMAPAGGSAQQQKGFMYFFPVFSVWICSSYNAAFSIYWVVSNLFTMLQQYVVGVFYPNLIMTQPVIKTLKEGDKK